MGERNFEEYRIHEPEKAKEIGTVAVQAAWYLVDGANQPVGRLPEFEQLESPMDLMHLVCV